MNKQVFIDAVEEATRELAVVEPIVEGLYDYKRVNVKDATRQHVLDALAKFTDIVDALNGFIHHGNRLIEMEVPSPETVDIMVMEDLDDQINTMTAAKAQFKVAHEATSVKMKFGTPQP